MLIVPTLIRYKAQSGMTWQKTQNSEKLVKISRKTPFPIPLGCCNLMHSPLAFPVTPPSALAGCERKQSTEENEQTCAMGLLRVTADAQRGN